jgi:hypothetical protein
MLNRREAVLGGALTLIWHSCACAQSAPRHHGLGCMLDMEDAEAFFATATAAQTFEKAERKLVASTGDRDFDYALAQTLSRLSDVFSVLPGFCFYDDYDGQNAFATPATKLRRADGSVLFGKRFFLAAMSKPEGPEVVVSAICAHEFGHIVQFKHKLMGRLNQGRQDVKRSELHADFLSGYFAGTRKLQKPDYPAAVFATTSYAGGDTLSGPKHHGTREERAAAAVRGFEAAYKERRSFVEALQISVNYVSRL